MILSIISKSPLNPSSKLK